MAGDALDTELRELDDESSSLRKCSALRNSK